MWKIKIVFIFLGLSFIKSYAQFNPKVDVIIFSGYSSLFEEKIELPHHDGYTDYDETQTSQSIVGGFSIYPNIFKNPKIKTGFTISRELHDNWQFESNLTNSSVPLNLGKRTEINSSTIDFVYLPIKKRIELELILGVGYSRIRMEQTARNFTVTDNDFIQNAVGVDSSSTILSWEEPAYKISFSSLATNLGVGLIFNVNEMVYIESKFKYALYYQNESEWANSILNTYSIQFGLGFRLLKTKRLY